MNTTNPRPARRASNHIGTAHIKYRRRRVLHPRVPAQALPSRRPLPQSAGSRVVRACGQDSSRSVSSRTPRPSHSCSSRPSCSCPCTSSPPSPSSTSSSFFSSFSSSSSSRRPGPLGLNLVRVRARRRRRATHGGRALPRLGPAVTALPRLVWDFFFLSVSFLRSAGSISFYFFFFFSVCHLALAVDDGQLGPAAPSRWDLFFLSASLLSAGSFDPGLTPGVPRALRVRVFFSASVVCAVVFFLGLPGLCHVLGRAAAAPPRHFLLDLFDPGLTPGVSLPRPLRVRVPSRPPWPSRSCSSSAFLVCARAGGCCPRRGPPCSTSSNQGRRPASRDCSYM